MEQIRTKAQKHVNQFDLTESGMLLGVQMFEAGYKAAQDDWIEIKEGCEMPVDRSKVLITHNGHVYTAHYYKYLHEKWEWAEEVDEWVPKPTPSHWRPIPNPPQTNKP